MNERTLVLVKPDGVQRLLAGRIIARFDDGAPERWHKVTVESGPDAGAFD